MERFVAIAILLVSFFISGCNAYVVQMDYVPGSRAAARRNHVPVDIECAIGVPFDGIHVYHDKRGIWHREPTRFLPTRLVPVLDQDATSAAFRRALESSGFNVIARGRSGLITVLKFGDGFSPSFSESRASLKLLIPKWDLNLESNVLSLSMRLSAVAKDGDRTFAWEYAVRHTSQLWDNSDPYVADRIEELSNRVFSELVEQVCYDPAIVATLRGAPLPHPMARQIHLEKPRRSLSPLSETEILSQFASRVVRIRPIDTTQTSKKSFGSGACVRNRYTVITAAHVVADDSTVLVDFHEYRSGEGFVARSLPAAVVDIDYEADIALLELIEKDAALEPVPIAFTRPPAGESVYALGFGARSVDSAPLGVALGKVHSKEGRFGNGMYMPHSARLEPGNSGGPLINGYGELVGINSSRYGEDQMWNFAVDCEIIMRLLSDWDKARQDGSRSTQEEK